MMDRDGILQLIESALSDSSTHLASPPLHDVVEQVGRQLRQQHGAQNDVPAAVGDHAVVDLPLEMVAAYVDGTLSRDEQLYINRRLVHNSHLMTEVVSAIAATQRVPSRPRLERPLRDRLLAIGGAVPASVPPANSAVLTHSKPSHRKSLQRALPVFLVAAAALMLATMAWRLRPVGEPAPSPAAPRIVVEPALSKDVIPSPAGELTDSVDESVPRLVEDQSDSSPLPSPEERITPSNNPAGIVVDQSKMMDAPANKIARPMPQPITSDLAVNPTELLPTSQNLRWETISGVLAVQSAIDMEETSESFGRPWRSFLENARVTIARDTGGQDSESIHLRTLPLTRAEAVADDGSQWILRADSALSLRRDGTVDLQFGSLAIVNASAGTRLQMARPSNSTGAGSLPKPPLAIEVLDKGTLIATRLLGGVRFEIQSGEFLIDEQTSDPNANSTTIQRLPRWVQQPVDRITVPRTFLAQLRNSSDLGETLGNQIQQIETGLKLPRGAASSLPTLCRWQASVMDDQLHRLMGSASESVRLAALERLWMIGPQDPRHDPMWRALRNHVRDQRAIAFALAVIRLAHQQTPLSPTQTTRLVTILESDAVAARAIADFLLRQSFRGGPPFDPTWTGTTLSRGINAWRTRVTRNR
ncbi:MAG: hypothetical protein AAGJ40_07675 [Planctomycetota bacterium]